MIEKELLDKYGEYLSDLDISETRTSLRLSMIKVKPEYRYNKHNYENSPRIGTKIMTDLVKYADDNMKIITLTPDNIDGVKVELAFEKTPDLRTTAYYHNSDRRVKVYVKDRAKIDIMRSIAHELVHHKQNIDGRLTDPEIDGADGSPMENEANSLAGIIMRKWGRIHPEDYI